MRYHPNARVAARTAALGLLFAGIPLASAQTASPPTGTVEQTGPVPSSAAMDKGVPPAKHAGDEGGTPPSAAPSSAQGSTPGAAARPAAPAQ